MKHPAIQLALIAAGMFVASFFLPAVAVGSEPPSPGWLVFVTCVFVALLWPVALANAAFLVGLAHLFRHRWRQAQKMGVLALILALSESWLFWPTVEMGYIVWLTSMAFLALAGWQGIQTERVRVHKSAAILGGVEAIRDDLVANGR